MLDNKKMMAAFDIYARLAANGEVHKLDVPLYWEDEDIAGQVEIYARHVKCVLVTDADTLYLLPAAVDSPFHISNDQFKKKYMTAKSVNMDIYLMYMAIIVLFGCFYDSYQSDEPNDFVTMPLWLEAMDSRIESLRHHDEAVLREAEGDCNFNWLALMQKWSDMDSLKETAKKQDARTNSRLSFLNMTKAFLVHQHLVREIGEGEMELTTKARAIFAHYFMESAYNHGILDFMYDLEQRKGDHPHALHQ